jgi:uncharacterized membrane protein
MNVLNKIKGSQMELRKKYMIKSISASSILCFVFLALFSSCKYDNEEDLYPGSQVCDTSAVTFSSSVQPILQNRCVSCHSGAFPSAGIDLSTYQNINIYAQNGSLVGVIDHQSGFSPMPQGTPKMPQCEIDKIKTWVNSGSPNN